MRIWRTMFWLSIVLMLLFVAGIVLGLTASDGSGSVWFYIPQLATLALWPLMVRFIYRRWQRLRAAEQGQTRP